MMFLLIIVGAYLLGSVSFAMLMSYAFRLPDPRTYGSHNPGATNVLRSGKKLAAALTLLGDAAKGWLAVWLAQHFAPVSDRILGEGTLWFAAAVALAVFMGHLFPIFLRFKGGKGVATALGIMLAINIWLGLAALGTWILVLLIFRYSSLSALLAALCAPAFAWLLKLPTEYIVLNIVVSLLLIWRHKPNIQNLLSGKEGKIGKNN